jgi:hypothetical protein
MMGFGRSDERAKDPKDPKDLMDEKDEKDEKDRWDQYSQELRSRLEGEVLKICVAMTLLADLLAAFF